MAIIGTFGSFTAARLGIYASQSALNVTGNNIANINTDGYTRQRIDLVSLNSWGSARYANKMNMDVGYGVLLNGVSQLRDPFIDIRYRDEQANVGASETWLECMKQLSHTLDEVGDGNDFGIWEKQFNDFAYQLQQYNGNVGTIEYDTTARSSAEVLCNLFNSYAKALEKVESTQLKNLKDDVISVNTMLTQIRDLSEEIREAGIHGAKALELRDERNVLIDELSKYIKIDVSYDMEKLDEFISVERLNISIADSGNPPIRLICGTYGTQLEMPERTEALNPDYDPDSLKAMRYIHKDSNPAAGEFLYTNDESEALHWTNGGPYWNIQSDWEYLCKTQNIEVPKNVESSYYEAKVANKYLKDGGGFTNDPEQAQEIDNAVEGSDNNRLWMSLQPLENRHGQVLRDSRGEKSQKVDLGDNLLYGKLQSLREFIIGKGEFSNEMDMKYDNDATTTRGVPYFRKSLDALAKKFAEEFNKANTEDSDPPTYEKVFWGYETKRVNGVEVYDLYGTCNLVTGDGDAEAVVKALEDAGFSKDYLQRVDLSDLPDDLQQMVKILQSKHLPKPGHGKELKAGGVLFSNDGDGDDPTGITASNITISKSWSTGEVRLLNTKKPEPWEHSTADDNIAHMINLISAKLDYLPKEGAADAAGEKRYFSGSFQERFADMNVILSVDQETTTTLYNSYSIKSLSLENDRQSVCGVDLNDEATNMMVFQKSYAAACKLMTVLDSMLDKLINGTI